MARNLQGADNRRHPPVTVRLGRPGDDNAAMEPRDARVFWTRFEPVHAVTYFAPECEEANRAVGLKGFWMGYFAARSAPLGTVGAGTVTATFFNFAPGRVRRAIPDAWDFTNPLSVVSARQLAAARVLRAIGPEIEALAESVAPRLRRVVESTPGSGRPLFLANREIPVPDDPTEALWLATTCLREHRGDGHVSLLTAAGLDGCEALVLFAATEGLAPEMLQNSRGWTADEWAAAAERLSARGLFGQDGLSAAGRALRERVEADTDALAAGAFAGLPDDELDALGRDLRALADRVLSAEIIRFPNPMGLPRAGSSLR